MMFASVMRLVSSRKHVDFFKRAVELIVVKL
jgi:hypothetical protein